MSESRPTRSLRDVRCMTLFPRKRTSIRDLAMSQKCHKQTCRHVCVFRGWGGRVRSKLSAMPAYSRCYERLRTNPCHDASFPLLNSIISRGFSYAVGFHGFDDPEIPFDILIGGAAPYPLKQDIDCHQRRDHRLGPDGAHRLARRGVRRL
jgi:hypothetical protein